MYYVILEKDLETEIVSVHSVYDDEETAVDAMNELIESTEDYGYKMGYRNVSIYEGWMK